MSKSASNTPARADVHDRVWQTLGEPGAVLDAATRIAIAHAARAAADCPLCRDRKAALSPRGVAGTHLLPAQEATDSMRPAHIEVAHSVATDASRLTRAWFDELELEPAEYAETLVVTILVVSFDTFARASGTAPRAIPTPTPGAPDGRVASNAKDLLTGWIPMQRRAGMPNIGRALTLVPELALVIRELAGVDYVNVTDIMNLSANGESALSRQQIELVAACTSARNECFY